MKIKKILSILLVLSLLTTILVACEKDEKEKTRTINPELVELFGEDFVAEQEKDIAKLVSELEECYAKYQKSKDIDAFCNDLNNGIDIRHDYLLEIRDELSNMQSNSMNDLDRYSQIQKLHTECVSYKSPYTIWSIYISLKSAGREATYTKSEVENSLFDYINAISEFFYCEKIA